MSLILSPGLFSLLFHSPPPSFIFFLSLSLPLPICIIGISACNIALLRKLYDRLFNFHIHQTHKKGDWPFIFFKQFKSSMQF